MKKLKRFYLIGAIVSILAAAIIDPAKKGLAFGISMYFVGAFLGVYVFLSLCKEINEAKSND